MIRLRKRNNRQGLDHRSELDLNLEALWFAVLLMKDFLLSHFLLTLNLRSEAKSLAAVFVR